MDKRLEKPYFESTKSIIKRMVDIDIAECKDEELEKGLLKVGNILDGNHRLQKVARYLLECSEEERENFRLTCFLGKVDVMKYATINAQYFAKPTIKKVLVFLQRFMGKDVEKIEKRHFMTFFERWYLLLQRIGYYKEKIT